LCNIRISDSEIAELQKNLVMSHACGAGNLVPIEIVRMILLLKIMSLSKGYSGVRVNLVQRLCDFFNRGIIPVVYQQGSLGASGDLAPLAHISLPILGMGEVYYKGNRMDAATALSAEGLEPLELEAKEGLALLNGTQFSTAYALWSLIQAIKIAEVSDDCAALSCDAFACNASPFLPYSHQIRPHIGQITVAKNIMNRLSGSALFAAPKENVQDPYSFRCVPQVHGASRDTFDFVKKTIETELNSVTDNPNIFEEQDSILSAGNFHAQPIAFASDFMAIALAELANISERRIFQLISGLRGLPAFLVSSPGLHSGMMIPQYTAASIVSQNKQLCTPASVDSIVSSAGQEDHVSMASNAGTKLYQVVENVWTVLAIEWMVAAQAIEFRRPMKSSPYLESSLEIYRRNVPALDMDRVLYPDIARSRDFVRNMH
jgi:histidine ammonia-lyase